MTVNKDQPRIQTYVAVRAGGKNDPAETTGLAHYFEHLMFKGTDSFGTQNYEQEKPMLDRIEALFEVYRKTTDEAQRTALYRQIDSVSYEASKIAIPNEYDKLTLDRVLELPGQMPILLTTRLFLRKIFLRIR